MNELKPQMNTEDRRLLSRGAAERIRTSVAGCRSLRRGGVALAIVALWLLTLASTFAEQVKPFPSHWGEPPAIQTHDYVEWSGGYGHGSGTVAKWIESNMAKDDAAKVGPSEVIYTADLSAVEIGELPDDFLVLNGEFSVQEHDGKKVMELPGAPIESFAVMFGPATNQNTAVSARVYGTSKGRRYPAFAVGINGLGGYRLRVTPATRTLELLRGPEEAGEVIGSASYTWKSDSWTNLKIQLRKTGNAEWKIEGKAWQEGTDEPAAWQISATEGKEPLPGRPFVTASPYSGTAMQFAEFAVCGVTAQD